MPCQVYLHHGVAFLFCEGRKPWLPLTVNQRLSSKGPRKIPNLSAFPFCLCSKKAKALRLWARALPPHSLTTTSPLSPFFCTDASHQPDAANTEQPPHPIKASAKIIQASKASISTPAPLSLLCFSACSDMTFLQEKARSLSHTLWKTFIWLTVQGLKKKVSFHNIYSLFYSTG